MIELEKILEEWREDCTIDNLRLDETSRNTPLLHAKYLELLSQSKLRLKRAELKQKSLLKDKWLWYNGKMSQEEVAEKLSTSMNGIIVTTLIVTLIGFILYFKKQYKDYKGDFSILKFIFGKTSCASMK